MPWTSLEEPSLALAILKAKLGESGIPCRIVHLNIFLLKYLKAGSYKGIANLYAFNDFLFTRLLEGEHVSDEQLAVLKRMVERNESKEVEEARAFMDAGNCVDYALRVRNEVVPPFLADCLKIVDESPASMVGFTCLFDQTIPSLALAKLIKQRHPDKLIVFGGYAIEPPVGNQVLRSFPFVDVVAFGEGENKVAALARASVNRDLLESIPGILYRTHEGEIRATSLRAAKVNLDESPVPDYGDWFRDLERLKEECQVSIRSEVFPVESSRGCWWGEKSHCVFCGIDDETMRYRSKSPERVIEMLDMLHERYGCRSFRFSDYILPRSYYRTLLPILAEREQKYFLHWEMKSNIKSEDARLMRRAGIRRIQPGIESFSTPVLKKMGKGVTGIQNVLTIKLLMEHDIEVLYNLLYGFPDDELSDYREMSRQLPLLYHLTPTDSCMPVLTVRNAPLSDDPQRFRIKRPVVARDRYHVIFSREFRERIGFVLEDYCYTFQTPYDYDPALATQYGILRYQSAHWLSLYRKYRARLSYELLGDGIAFVDARYDEAGKSLRFGREHAVVYQTITDAILSRRQIVSAVGGQLEAESVSAILNEFVEARLVYEEEEKFLGLALPVAFYERQAARMRV